MNTALAQRYAAALVDVAMERKETDAVQADLAAFAQAFFASSPTAGLSSTFLKSLDA